MMITMALITAVLVMVGVLMLSMKPLSHQIEQGYLHLCTVQGRDNELFAGALCMLWLDSRCMQRQ
jgi:hypothetical protein